MENLSQDKLQNMDNVPALLSQSMEVVNGVQTSCSSPKGSWFVQQSPPVATTSQEFLSFSPSYNFSSKLPIGSSPSAIYTSSYPWEDKYSQYSSSGSIASSMSVPSPQTYTNSDTVSPVQLDYQSRSISPQGFANHDVAGQLQAFPSPPPYPYQGYSNSAAVSSYNSYSVDDSPISSPESLDIFVADKPNGVSMPQVIPSCLMTPQPISTNMGVISYATTTLGYPRPTAMQADSKVIAKKQVRMPQRKGGIQLWQFLYALLSNKQHSNLIEWTSNRGANEFRMLEPESIAVWWGTIKSKPTMTYDKFSRSLRYYYHKGLLKKIQGERYMYRFLVDPEDMYRHIGSTDKRPELKSMPKEAKLVMGIFQKNGHMASEIAPIVTKPPEGLPSQSNSSNTSKSFKVEGFGLDFNNSNNTENSFIFPQLEPPLPILIPAGAW